MQQYWVFCSDSWRMFLAQEACEILRLPDDGGFPKTIDRDVFQKPFLKRSMAVLSNIRADFLHDTSKIVQMVPNLPVMTTQFDAPTFAASVRFKCGERGLREISTEIGSVSPSTLSRIERGAVPDLETFPHLCDWLQLPTSSFIHSVQVI